MFVRYLEACYVDDVARFIPYQYPVVLGKAHDGRDKFTPVVRGDCDPVAYCDDVHGNLIGIGRSRLRLNAAIRIPSPLLSTCWSGPDVWPWQISPDQHPAPIA